MKETKSQGVKTRSQIAKHSQVNLALMANVIQAPVEPKNYNIAMQDPRWNKAMEDELVAISKNHTWDLVTSLVGWSIIGTWWVYKIKYHANGSIEKFKARLVVQGYGQREGIDYKETFAPITKMTTIRSVVAIAASYGWPLYQYDVKIAFLNGDIQEEVYVRQPFGFAVKGQEDKVCKNKALYGLKQAPHAWYSVIHSCLLSYGFEHTPMEPNLYVL